MKLTEKKKKVFCTIGIICLFLFGLYAVNRKQINKFIMQHKISSLTSKSHTNSTEQESKNKLKNPKFKFTQDEVYEAIRNTRTLKGGTFWHYTDTSYNNAPFWITGGWGYPTNDFESDNFPKDENGKYATNRLIYIALSRSMDSLSFETLSNNISKLIAEPSSTSGCYDLMEGNDIGGIKNDIFTQINIIVRVPGLNIETNTDGLVTSISYCSSVINPMDNNPISYKSYPFEQYIKDRKDKYAYDTYIPEFVYDIDISDIMRYLNYKNSEYDIYEDFTIEQKNTDIEFYSVHEDGSLELECTSKTGTITTIKFN